MRFLVDTQLPAALAAWLREQGHATDHVLELGLAQAKDNLIWERGTSLGAVVITKDEDFADWVRRGRSGPSVVWIRVGNCSTRQLLSRFAPLLPQILRQLEAAERLVEVR